MKKLLTTTLLIVMLCIGQLLNGQQFLGNVQGNYNTTQAMLQNPAQVYPDRNRVYIHWWSFGAEFNNNYLRYAAPFSLWKWSAGNIPSAQQNRFGRVNWNDNWLESFGDKNQKFFNYISTSQGPSFAFRVHSNYAFGFSTRTVQGISITGIQEPLALIGRYGIQSTANRFPGNGLSKNTAYSNGAFSINSDNYQEFNFTFGRARGRKTEHLWKTGFTGRFLLGFGAAYAGGANLNYRFEGRDSLFIEQADFRTGHTGSEDVLNALNNPLGLWFEQVNGVGFGFDYGFVYEFRPERASLKSRHLTDCWYERNRDYRLRLGASLRDVGMIAYFNGSSRQAEVRNAYWQVNRNLVNGYDPFGSDIFHNLDSGFTDKLGPDVSKSDAFATFTPAALNVQFDYHFGNGWYLGANLNQNLRGKTGPGLRSMSQLSLVPRYEREGLEVGMPLSLTGNYQKFTYGLYGRFGPFIIGTDNLPGLAKMSTGGKMSGASLYGGFRWKINPCPWWVNTREELVSPITDTFRKDSIQIQKDTIRFRDTVSIEKRIRDTVYVNRNTAAVSAEVKKKEQELLKKEEDLKRREAAVIAKETQQNRNTGNCCEELAIVSGKLQQEQDRSARLQTQVNALNQDKISLNNQLNQCRTGGTGSTVTAEVNRLKSENDNLKAANTKLQQDLTKCGDNSSVLTAEVNTLKNKVSSLESQLAQCKAGSGSSTVAADANKLKTENDNLKNEAATLKARIASLEGQLAQCKAGSGNSSTVTAEVNKLKTENDALRARNAQLEADLNKEKAAGSTLTAQVNTLKKQNSDQQTRIALLEADLQKCKNEGASAAITAEVNRLKKESDDQKLKIAALETDLAKEQAAKSTLSAEVNSLKKQNAEQQTKISVLEAELKKCKDEGASATITAEVNRLKKESDEQKAKIASLEAELQKCKSTDASSTLTAEINKLKSENSTLKAKVGELEQKVAETKDCSDELAALKQKNAELENQIKAVKAEYQFAMSENNKLKAQVADLEAKLKNCDGEAASKLEAEIAQLKRSNAELSTKVSQLEAENARLKQANSELDAKVKAAENNNSENQLNLLRQEYEALRQQNNTNREKARELESEVNALKSQIESLQAQLEACKNNQNGGGNGQGMLRQPAPEQRVGQALDLLRQLGREASENNGGGNGNGNARQNPASGNPQNNTTTTSRSTGAPGTAFPTSGSPGRTGTNSGQTTERKPAQPAPGINGTSGQ